MSDVVGDLLLVAVSGGALLLSQQLTALVLAELGYEPTVSGISTDSPSTYAAARLALAIVWLVMLGFFQFGQVYLALGFRPEFPLGRLASIVEVPVFIGWLVVVLRRARSSGRPRLRD